MSGGFWVFLEEKKTFCFSACFLFAAKTAAGCFHDNIILDYSNYEETPGENSKNFVVIRLKFHISSSYFTQDCQINFKVLENSKIQTSFGSRMIFMSAASIQSLKNIGEKLFHFFSFSCCTSIYFNEPF